MRRLAVVILVPLILAAAVDNAPPVVGAGLAAARATAAGGGQAATCDPTAERPHVLQRPVQPAGRPRDEAGLTARYGSLGAVALPPMDPYRANDPAERSPSPLAAAPSAPDGSGAKRLAPAPHAVLPIAGDGCVYALAVPPRPEQRSGSWLGLPRPPPR